MRFQSTFNVSSAKSGAHTLEKCFENAFWNVGSAFQNLRLESMWGKHFRDLPTPVWERPLTKKTSLQYSIFSLNGIFQTTSRGRQNRNWTTLWHPKSMPFRENLLYRYIRRSSCVFVVFCEPIRAILSQRKQHQTSKLILAMLLHQTIITRLRRCLCRNHKSIETTVLKSVASVVLNIIAADTTRWLHHESTGSSDATRFI